MPPESRRKNSSESTSMGLYRGYSCTHCDYKTTSSTNLKQHAFKYKHPQLKHPCSVCQQCFKSKKDLEAHTSTLHPDVVTKYCCFQCDYKTMIQRYLTKHLRKHLPESVKKEELKYQCSRCPRQFAKKYKLNEHVKYKHEKLIHFTCDICEQEFSHSSHFREHLKSHSNFVYLDCPLCGKKFRYKARLWLHLQNDHHQTNFIEYDIGWCSKPRM